jgi:hypothetical protein
MKFLLSFLLPLFAVLAQMEAHSQEGTTLWADPINGQTPSNSNPFNQNATGGGATKVSHITVSGIGHVGTSTPNGGGVNDIYEAAGWGDASLNQNKYLYFTLTPDPDYTINFTGFNCNLVSTGALTGPKSFQFWYSTDGGSSFTSVGSTYSITPTTAATSTPFSFSLNIPNITGPITFYLSAYGGTGAASIFGVADFEFKGTLIQPTNEDLPVTFGNLQATRNNGNVNIEWSTLTETHNSHFDVEVSADGNTFKKVATIQSKAANGMSAMPLSYRFSISANQVTGFAVPALFALLAVGFKNRRWRKAFVSLSLASVLFIAACSKKEAQGVQTKDNLFVRITQVDIDGGKSFSKIIKVVEGN